MEDGRIAYRMKRPLPDGTTHLLFTGLELLRRVASLVPPPRANLTRFHGVFAPGAQLRPFLVPLAGEEETSVAPQAAASKEPLMYSKERRGFSTRLAHCSGGPSQRPSTTPPLLPSPSTWPLSCLYAPVWSFFGPKNRIWSRECKRSLVLRGRRLESGGLLCVEAAAIEPAAHRSRMAWGTVPLG